MPQQSVAMQLGLVLAYGWRIRSKRRSKTKTFMDCKLASILAATLGEISISNELDSLVTDQSNFMINWNTFLNLIKNKPIKIIIKMWIDSVFEKTGNKV